MKWRIAEEKLLFLRKIMLLEERNITRRALLNETFMEIKGLIYECRQMTEMIGLPDIMLNMVSKGEINQAINWYSRLDLKEEVQNSNKVGDRWSEDPLGNTYLTYMSLLNSRVWMRYRASYVKGIKVNNTNSYNDLSFRYCEDDSQEYRNL